MAPLHVATLTVQRAELHTCTHVHVYRVNKAYNAVFEDSVVVSGAPVMDDWVSLYEGLARGLGGFNTNVMVRKRCGTKGCGHKYNPFLGNSL